MNMEYSFNFRSANSLLQFEDKDKIIFSDSNITQITCKSYCFGYCLLFRTYNFAFLKYLAACAKVVFLQLIDFQAALFTTNNKKSVFFFFSPKHLATKKKQDH